MFCETQTKAVIVWRLSLTITNLTLQYLSYTLWLKLINKRFQRLYLPHTYIMSITTKQRSKT